MKLKTILQTFGALTVVLTLARFIAVDYWWVRMFDFPHVQLTILSVIAFLAYFIKFDFKWRNDYIFATLMLVCMLYQFAKIYIYTPLASYEILEATSTDTDKQIKFFAANVLQKNKEKNHLLSEIKKADADILLLTETNQAWRDVIVNDLDPAYKYRVEIPLDNTYGMLMYSKLELVNPQEKYQVDDSIPSIHTKVRLRSGDLIQVYSIHPTPPMPQENPMSSERDKEMMMTAFLAKDNALPVVVVGDFNDVAWSQTTLLFQGVSGLLDPRKGRGLYNTFNAKNPIMRWPLDHVFASNEFRLVNMERCDDINSDHFPISATFSLEPDGAKEQTPEPASEEDIKNAKNQMKGSTGMDTDVY